MNKLKYVAVVCGSGLAILLASIYPAPDNSRPIRFAPEDATVETVESTAANPLSESVSETEPETETEEEGINFSPMYATTALNIRKWAEVCEESYLETVPINTQLIVIEPDPEHIWEMIIYKDTYALVYAEYFSPTPVVVPESAPTSAIHYGIWSGPYWHFTPEEIDNQWNGQKSGKPILPTGTTRAWQTYLYQKLEERGFAWFYEYAICQAMQESGMNPLNNINHTQISWLHGRATYDCGLFSFKDIYWNAAYGDICDYKANINAYVDRITPWLQANPNDINGVIAQHYDPYVYHQSYVDAVMSHMSELWICK